MTSAREHIERFNAALEGTLDESEAGLAWLRALDSELKDVPLPVDADAFTAAVQRIIDTYSADPMKGIHRTKEELGRMESKIIERQESLKSSLDRVTRWHKRIFKTPSANSSSEAHARDLLENWRSRVTTNEQLLVAWRELTAIVLEAANSERAQSNNASWVDAETVDGAAMP